MFTSDKEKTVTFNSKDYIQNTRQDNKVSRALIPLDKVQTNQNHSGRLIADGDLNTAFTYLIISIIVALFGAVYEYFSFGVWSAFMVYAFMVPLAGGALPFFLKHLMKSRGSAPLNAEHQVRPGRNATLNTEYQGNTNRGACAAADGTPRTIALSLYHSALATLTLGSIIQGVLEICGRPNSLTIVYLIAGAALLIASAVTAAVQKKRARINPGNHIQISEN